MTAIWQTGVSIGSRRNVQPFALRRLIAASKSSTSKPTEPPPADGFQSGATLPIASVPGPISYSTNPVFSFPKNRACFRPNTPS